MKDSLQKLLTVIALATGVGISGGYLIGGLASGSIDGPVRGRDPITFSEHPIGFCLIALFLLGITIGFASYAHQIAKNEPAA